MNQPDVLVGYVHRMRKWDLGRLYKQGFYACVTEDFFNNKGMFIQKIIRLCVVGVWYNKQKYNIKICCFLERFVIESDKTTSIYNVSTRVLSKK